MVKKLHKMSDAKKSSPQLSSAVKDSAQQIWLAGLGAFAKAQEEGSKVFDALVKEGSNEINGPSMTIDKPEAALDEARIAAITTGRARAEVYAAAAGMKIKRIVSISESDGMSVVPRPMMAMMTKSVEAADTVIMPGEQSLGMTVTMVFELQ